MTTPRTNTDQRSAANPLWTRFFGITERTPGPAWRSLYEATWESYRAWYLREGHEARPTLKTACRMLDRHMPELVPAWERLVELAEGDETTARFLTQWNPPQFLPGCSQAVHVGETPSLVRNYDYHPDLCERVTLSSKWTGRRVLGMSDCLWGLLDGMNDAGLAVSLAYGGRRGVGDGFGIPLIVRYLLELAETVGDVRQLLSRLPVTMAYNLTVADRNADVGTFFVAPDSKPEYFPVGLATNHRGRIPDRPDHARAFRSVERQNALMDAVAARPDREAFVSRFLGPPLHNSAYAQGFGTMYTAVYQPIEGVVEYVWPDSRWQRTYDSPTSFHDVRLGAGIEQIGPVALTSPRIRVDTGGVKSKAAGTSNDELARIARNAISALATSHDSAAFTHLLELSQHLGESLGESARNLAAEHSWAGVADYAGTSRQAAWARWNAP